MSLPAKVLLIGNGAEHLADRALVLRNFWRVDMAALDLGQTPEFEAELIVVCSTIAEPERQEWVERIRNLSALKLVIKMNGFDSGPFAGADAIVDEELGPAALVAKIYELLTEQGLPSRGWPGEAHGDLALSAQ